ncbi:unnamed protein product [Notodromas monacha]|uniref:Uncharacterized protein n=1 Tax=Notodromas monacha TaxID=399045 RepID=A0A7R9BIV7_9CRUS|nr:unnamed protein product [Notodromas monacha]CAG0914916.1 unnamed protein product [Notodromas monacha]
MLRDGGLEGDSVDDLGLGYVFAVINNYAGGGFGTPGSPAGRAFPSANSPGPNPTTIDIYSTGAPETIGYVQATSPQPASFSAIAVNRGPILTAAFTNGYH